MPKWSPNSDYPLLKSTNWLVVLVYLSPLSNLHLLSLGYSTKEQMSIWLLSHKQTLSKYVKYLSFYAWNSHIQVVRCVIHMLDVSSCFAMPLASFFISNLCLKLCRWKCAVMPLEALSSHGIELQVNVPYSCLCCKFQEWRSYEYNGGPFSSMLTWKKSSAMLFNCVHSSARQLSKPYCKHSLRFIQISTIMKLMLFMLNFKWQLLFFFFYFIYLPVLKHS